MFRFTLISLISLLSVTAWGAAPAQKPSDEWVGVEVCASCHAAEHEAWRGSHHDLAMQEVSDGSVLGNFDNAGFSYAGVESRFFRRGGEYWVETDGPDGKLTEFRVEYVFGVYPLQQYLLALSDGRLHALTIAWDSRTAEEGGQRWFHLYPEQSIDASDPLHWTGPYQNWNARCAECHSTNLQKNFSATSGEYSTTWSEINVACEACHGPGREHVRLAESGKLSAKADAGFPVDLSRKNLWHFPEGKSIAAVKGEVDAKPQLVESCGRCHARRGTLGDYHYGRDLIDTHRISLLEDPLYHLDGQIRDEVYVYGSFLQNRMYQAGVVCSDCHEPHSQQLRAPGNAVCAQCHQVAVYDTPAHHHHQQGSSGAQCVECHMPETTYMVVDPRRDHSMRVPRPDLSIVVGTPNACNQCHAEQGPEWALDQLRQWGTRFTDTAEHPARVLQRSRDGDGRAVPALEALALDPQRPAIWRATAMTELGGFANREAYDTALQLLDSEDPLLRLSAVRALEFMPPQQLLAMLGKHLRDPSPAVRLEIAEALSSLALEQLSPGQAQALQSLYDEYLNVMNQHADMPETQVQLGTFFTARQRFDDAESAYLRALELNPAAVDCHAQSGRPVPRSWSRNRGTQTANAIDRYRA